MGRLHRSGLAGWLALLALLAWVAPAEEASARRSPPPPGPETRQAGGTFEFIGRRSLVDLAAEFAESGTTLPEAQARLAGVGQPPSALSVGPAPVGQPASQAPAIPQAATRAVTSGAEGFSGFDGLNGFDSAVVVGMAVEPPDQGLCVGGGYVVEAVNSALTVFSTDASGTPLLPPSPVPGAKPAVAFNALFGLPPDTFTPPGPDPQPVYGPELFDPSCHFDQDVRRFFLVVTGLERDPVTRTNTGPSALYLAVTATENPLGDWATFKLDTEPGDRFDTGCPCFDDFPHVATDATGFFISANRFRLFVPEADEFVGPKIHGLSKRELARQAAAGQPTGVAAVSVTVDPVAGEPSFNLLPAITPPGAAFAVGRQYLLSTPGEFVSDDRLVVWALSNTPSLDGPDPELDLSHEVLATLPYVDPVEFPTVQRPGPFPLGESLHEPLGTLDSAFSGFHGVPYFNDGVLWGALPTAVQTPGDDPHAGVLWMMVRPTAGDGDLDATIVAQDYLAIRGDDLLYPALAVAADGRGAMVFSVAGPGRFPSAAFIALDGDGPAGPVRIVAAGNSPNDGKTCYTFGEPIDPTPCRYGDYSAARVDELGNIWLATEYNILGPRPVLTNWDTFVGRLDMSPSLGR